MDSGTAQPKEATILELSGTLQKQLADLTESLYERFRRAPRPDSGSAPRPTHINVLDQIIDNLEEDSLQLTCIIDLLHADVFSKIS